MKPDVQNIIEKMGMANNALKRLVKAYAYEGLNNATNSFTPVDISGAYKERISYDANGNIQTALLNGNAANLAYEDFTYNYDVINKNRLLNIHNTVDNTTSHYEYDEIGNVTKDELEGNNVLEWNVYGKLNHATKSNGTQIAFMYDAAGNRIGKKVGSNKEEWTVRDASGNIMATYIKDPAVNSGKLTTQGYEMYGSNAIGTWEKLRDVETPGADNHENMLTRGEQKIRVSNQLGNTMAVLSDAREQIQDPNNPAQILGYRPVVLQAADYSAYGENLIGREYNSNGIKFGFNGKLNDNDLGYQDYGMRLSSVRKRGFLSVDPLTPKYPELTPYQFASNRPIQAKDRDGEEAQFIVGFFVGMVTELGQQTIGLGIDNLQNGKSFFADWGSKIDWADVGIAGVAGGLNTLLPGAGQAVFAERAAGYTISETLSNGAKSAVNYTGEKGNQNIFDGSKNIGDFSKDMIVNTAGSVMGSVVPLTATKPVLKTTTSGIVKETMQEGVKEVALNVPRGGLIQTGTALIVDEARKKPIAIPPLPVQTKHRLPLPPSPKPKPKQQSRTPVSERIRFTFTDENGQSGSGDVPNNQYGKDALKKMKNITIVNN